MSALMTSALGIRLCLVPGGPPNVLGMFVRRLLVTVGLRGAHGIAGLGLLLRQLGVPLSRLRVCSLGPALLWRLIGHGVQVPAADARHKRHDLAARGAAAPPFRGDATSARPTRRRP